jgi:hypothetical protein
MIEVTMKFIDGENIDQTLLLSIEDLLKNETIKDELYEMWNEEHNECICSLNESQSFCECEGIYGCDVEVSKVEILQEEIKQ